MVGGPLLGLPAPPTGGAGPHDEDAREVIAFSRSYAGKLEEVKDLVNEHAIKQNHQHRQQHQGVPHRRAISLWMAKKEIQRE